MPDRPRDFVLPAVRRPARSALATAQDHKRIFDDDKGPNTGGMGRWPRPLMHPGLASAVMQRIVRPSSKAMRDQGDVYRGFLLSG